MANESGKTISDADRKKINKKIKGGGPLLTPGQKKKLDEMTGKSKPMEAAMGGKVQKMNMGGQVMDTTKSMPVGMMDGGKVKPMKMNMGGVIPGRGGMFKGMK